MPSQKYLNIHNLHVHNEGPLTSFQRQGCVHGEELNYVFGLPLLAAAAAAGSERNTPGVSNFTRSEALLSRIIIHHWANFAATG